MERSTSKRTETYGENATYQAATELLFAVLLIDWSVERESQEVAAGGATSQAKALKFMFSWIRSSVCVYGFYRNRWGGVTNDEHLCEDSRTWVSLRAGFVICRGGIVCIVLMTMLVISPDLGSFVGCRAGFVPVGNGGSYHKRVKKGPVSGEKTIHLRFSPTPQASCLTMR